jgi:hypothetical protein
VPLVLAAIPLARAQLAPVPATAPATDRCYACHLDIESPEAKAYSRDVHFARGVGCADCHGGDPTTDDQDAGMSKAHGYLGKLRKSDIPKVCGKCHGPGENALQRRYKLTNVRDSLAAGAHGEALRASEKGPQCVSCHGVHDIAPVDHPRSPVHALAVAKTCGQCHSDARYMREFNPRLPVDQHVKYLTSQHGRLNAQGDPKPATCVSCHSNHLIHKVKDPRSPVYATRIPETCAGCHSDEKYMKGYKIPTNQLSEYRKSAHGVLLLEKSDLNAPACNSCHGNHAAIPPGPSAIVAVCGNCHQANAELFEKSSHRDAFAKRNLSGCVVCHGNHGIRTPTDALVTLDERSPCAKCHASVAADTSVASLHRIRGLLDSLNLGKREVERLLGDAEQLGMDVSDAAYELKGAHQALVQSRVAVHSFRVADLEAAARPGLDIVASVRKAGRAAIHEYHFRRQGLVVSTLIVTVLAVLIYLKIRQLEKGEAQT